jgi:hypothetical protein
MESNIRLGDGTEARQCGVVYRRCEHVVGESRDPPAYSRTLIRECERIAAEARRLRFQTRARIVRALPGVDEERAALLAVAERAEGLARQLSSSSRPPPPARRPRPRGDAL